MDQLEKLISENRDFFGDQKMAEGHLKRFEDRLKPARTPMIRLVSPWIAAAAVVVVVLMVAIPRHTSTQQMGALSQVSDKYSEVEYYFTSSISKRRRVVLPIPLGPTRAILSPRKTLRFRFSQMVTSSKLLSRLSIESACLPLGRF